MSTLGLNRFKQLLDIVKNMFNSFLNTKFRAQKIFQHKPYNMSMDSIVCVQLIWKLVLVLE